MTSSTNFFSKYKPDNFKKPVQTQTQVESPVEEKKEFSFKDFKPEEFPEETKFDSLLRQSAQYASRAIERIGGFIPDTKNFLSDLIIDSYEKAGVALGEGEKQREAPEWLQSALGRNKKMEMTGNITSGPTSSKLKEFSEKATKGYTKPRSYAEEKIGNVVGDISSSLLGGNKSIKNNLLVPIGANMVESALETMGFDKEKQTFGKLGSWFLLGTAANANANKYVSKMQQDARNSLAPNTPTNLNTLGRELRPLNRKWISNDPRSQSAQNHINSILTDLKNGKASVEDLMERISAINAEIDLKNGFDYSMKTPSKVKKAEIKNLNELKGSLYSAIEDSTKNQPGFFKNFMDAQTAHASVAQSNKWVEFVKKHYGKFTSAGLASLVGGLYVDPTLTAIGSVGLLGLHKGAQVAIRMYKSPILRKYYLNSIKAVANDNVPVFIQNMQKLDSELKKEERKKNSQRSSKNRNHHSPQSNI